MDTVSLSQSPFAVVTFIAAPALLTNASSVLAMSTINRMLRTRERMREIFLKSEAGTLTENDKKRIVSQTNRVEQQALLLLRALHLIYIALGSFAAATLVTLLGAALVPFDSGRVSFDILAAVGLLLGFTGVGGLVLGSINLFHATQLSMINIREEANLIRERQAAREKE